MQSKDWMGKMVGAWNFLITLRAVVEAVVVDAVGAVEVKT